MYQYNLKFGSIDTFFLCYFNPQSQPASYFNLIDKNDIKGGTLCYFTIFTTLPSLNLIIFTPILKCCN